MTEKNNFFHVYALLDCPFCKLAVDLLRSKNKIFVLSVMDNDKESLVKIKEKFNHKTVPIITALNENKEYDLVGGYMELAQLLND